MKVKQELGNVYGYLTVVAFIGLSKTGHALWSCKCRCGKETSVFGSNLRQGTTRSCGCFLVEIVTKHGGAKRVGHKPEYGIYHSAKERCTNPKDAGYVNYGGRGIEFKFSSFPQFYEEVGPRPTGAHSLDRIDNEGNYEHGNVQWASRSDQNRNQRKRLRVEQWSNDELLNECRRRGLADEPDKAEVSG
jgi:hypothetical protein